MISSKNNLKFAKRNTIGLLRIFKNKKQLSFLQELTTLQCEQITGTEKMSQTARLK